MTAPFRRSLLSGALVLLLSAGMARAQYSFDNLTTNNGLPQNGVRAIVQTPDGYIWFTTFDGLVRSDGEKLTVFDKNNSPGIASNRFSLLHVEKDGTLLAGTEDGYLTEYKNGKFRSLIADKTPGGTVVAFTNDAHGEFYLRTHAGNFYYGAGNFPLVPSDLVPNELRFLASPKGGLWLYDRDGLRFIATDKHETYYPIAIEGDLVNRTVFEDSRGFLWLGNRGVVYRLKDGVIEKFTAMDGVPAEQFLRPQIEDDDGTIWFASNWLDGAGLVHFQNGKFETFNKSSGLPSNDIDLVFKDREGSIWVIPHDHGISRLRKELVKSLSVAEGLPSNEVYPLTQTRAGDIYVGTTRGLSRLTPEGRFVNVLVKTPEGGPLLISVLGEGEGGRLWIGAGNGDLYQLENGVPHRFWSGPNYSAWSIQKTGTGTVLVGTAAGLQEFKDHKLIARFTTSEGLPSDDIKIIYPDREGRVWLGTYGGLVEMKAPAAVGSAPTFVTYTTKEGLPSDRVRTIYEDATGTLWIGTYDGGLSRFRDGNFFNYTIQNGLFNNGVFQIIEDSRGNFWISCNRGIYRVSKSELEQVAAGQLPKVNCVAYGKADGMLNTECNGGRQPAGFKAQDGTLWFPTQDGVAIVNPNEVSFNRQPPTVQIEGVLVERAAMEYHDGITLAAGSRNLAIRYTGITFIKPEQVKFRYRIGGLDEKWTDVGTIRELYFPSLPHGDFTFQIMACNSDGVCSTQNALLKVHVLAPFWQRGWFVALTSLLVIAIVLSIVRIRERELKRRQLVQEQFSHKLMESQEQERQRIAAALHDSLGQSLLIIKNRAFLALRGLPEPQTAKEHLEELTTSAADAIDECREISYNLRPYQLGNYGLTKTLELVFERISEVSEIATSTEVDSIDDLFSAETQINIYRVVQETVNNIIKHSSATEAQLVIKRVQDKVQISIKDNGRGFDLNHPPTNDGNRGGFGLLGLAERVRMLGGEYKIAAQPGHGTTITIRLAPS